MLQRLCLALGAMAARGGPAVGTHFVQQALLLAASAPATSPTVSRTTVIPARFTRALLSSLAESTRSNVPFPHLMAFRGIHPLRKVYEDTPYEDMWIGDEMF